MLATVRAAVVGSAVTSQGATRNPSAWASVTLAAMQCGAAVVVHHRHRRRRLPTTCAQIPVLTRSATSAALAATATFQLGCLAMSASKKTASNSYTVGRVLPISRHREVVLVPTFLSYNNHVN